MFWLLTIVPLIPTLLLYQGYRSTLRGKLEDIRSLLKKDSIYRAYARYFGRNAPTDIHGKAEEIEKMFRRHYSHWMYLIPLALVGLITVVYSAAWAVGVANSLNASIGLNPDDLNFVKFLAKIPPSCQAGFWGAYTWGLYDLILRYRSRDFTPAFSHSMWIRLLTSSLIAGFFSTTGKIGDNPLVDFAIGSLPTVELVRWIQSLARKHLGVREQTEPTEAPTLHHLQGATRAVISRLGEEGIESAHQLAYTDPFLLYLRTNLDWVTGLDLIDQALLFNYLTSKLSRLYSAGIRGSIEFARISLDIAANGAIQPEADRLLDQLCKILSVERPALLNLIQTCGEDYHVNLIEILYGEAFGDPKSA